MTSPEYVRVKRRPTDERWRIAALKWNEPQQGWWASLELISDTHRAQMGCPVNDLLPVYSESEQARLDEAVPADLPDDVPRPEGPTFMDVVKRLEAIESRLNLMFVTTPT